MASHKEEPNTSLLFGDSPGDDPFSQLQQQQQQHPASEPAAKKDEVKDKQPAVSTAQEQQPKAVVGDAASLFGNSGDGNADLFFSSTNASAHATPQSVHPPLATNASAASFFDQPQAAATTAYSFFDDLGQQHSATDLTQSYSQESQQHSTNPASNLTQAYDPNTCNSYDYSQQPALQEQEQQQQQYDQAQWIQFDPNQHYYYDDQGQVHYYDPNTNQEYDMSQYGYDQQGQTYDYQYNPQYAEYYAQQGYDPNAYAATTAATDAGNIGDQQQQAYASVQDNYDPSAYAPTTATPQPSESATATAAAASDLHYYQPSNYAAHPSSQMQQQQADYSSQSYAPMNTNAVAEVPAQLQSEQTIDTQHYTAEQQQDPYSMQSYPAVDTSAGVVADADQQQQSDYNYQSYDPNTATTAVTTSEFEQSQFGQDVYAPVDLNNTNYSSIQADFEAEDLQQPQAPPPPPAAASKDVGPPPPAGPPKSVLSPPPPPPKSTNISPPPPQTNTPLATLTAHRDSMDVNEVPELSEQQKEAPQEDLNDLDDLVLGGSDSQQQQQDLVSNMMDRLTVADGAYDTEKTTDEAAAKHSRDVNVASSTEDQKVPEAEIKTEPTVFASVLSADEPCETKNKEEFSINDQKEKKEEEKPAITSQDASYFPLQSSEDHTGISSSQHVLDQNEQISSYEPDQSITYDFNYGSEPTTQPAENAYEPDQAIGFESQAVTGYEPTTSYEPQQASAYDPEQVASYEPSASYEPQQQTAHYEPRQNDTYAPQETSYEPQQTSGYEPTGHEPQSTNAYDPSNTTTRGYEPQQYGGYESAAPSTQYGAPLPTSTTAASERNMTSPPPSGPPRAGSIKSVASPPPAMQSYYPQRANSITEPDRRHHSSSPFAGYYGNNNGMNPQYPVMERSATVPPPMTERMASPRPQLIPCPDRLCEGENKPKAKFCCECGRPLAGISRSTTPSAISPSAYSAAGMEGFSPMSTAVFGSVAAEPVQRTALDEKKDEMVASLKQFVENSVVVQVDLDEQEKRRRAMAYIDSRLASFVESKAILWRVVQAMMEHSTCVLGDGGELDKSIIALVSSWSQDSSQSASSDGHLDQLEALLSKGDREAACQFANDHDMWAHSLVIASSVNDALFKKTVTQFIQRELFAAETELVPQVPGDRKSLRMLYSVFNGAGADAVSDYAKTSAHAEAVFTDETLQGWQSALTLILANRSTNDQAAIQGLGDQLKHLNKHNEARLCYLLSPDVSGLDNSKLIGDDLYTDLDALYLVELYEFASKASIQQDFKLVLAWWLKDLGFSAESQKYTEAISAKLVGPSSLDKLKQVGDISPAADSSSENVTSLLNQQSFDALIGSIDAKVTSITTSFGDSSNYASANYTFDSQGDYNSTQAHDYTGQEAAADSLQHDAYNYGYGYGGGYTEAADATVPQVTAVTSPFGKPKGIQSPFQTNVQPVSSPFGMQNKATAAVTSPFGQAAPATNDNNNAWWGASDGSQTQDSQTSYQPYQPEANANTSYQPDAYTPAAAATTSTPAAGSSAWDDDDDLGFGNSKPKKKQEQDADTKTTDSKVQEKPNEVDDKKEKEHTEKPNGGGWGIFSLFGRKEKDPNAEEKKAVKANLGEQSSFYYDEKEKRWVNKLNDTKPASATPPPPPKAATPQPPASKPMVPPPVADLKPSSMPPPRINSAPNVPSMSGSGGLPNAAPPAFNTPQTSRRAAGGGRKSVRSRYVDVLSADQK
ncbi:uncharacterized protein ATC70_006800 [Mucor velutinosus]|uniref:COPII coat assembly protein SEC16 n=1 Tax=Mucor velutinosus TaxID=708070 RepID=A0AAN7DPQ9_9FUNG|nr:hypothetical protein ATC70_006800 [Mucor velutinosus]